MTSITFFDATDRRTAATTRVATRVVTRTRQHDLAAVPAAIRSEWIKLRSLRSNRAIFGFTIVAGVVMSWVLATFVKTDPYEHLPFTVANTFMTATWLTTVLAVIAGILMYTSEVQHGTIANTIAAQPARWVAVAAKAAVAAGFGLAMGVVGIIAGLASAVASGMDMGDTSGLAVAAAWGLVLTSLAAVLGVGIGMIIRHSSAAVSTALVWTFVLENLGSDAALMRQPGFEALQHYWMTPWFDNVRFGRWDEIAATPNPAADLGYVSVVWHYAEGIAAARQGRADDARQHLAAMRPLVADPAMRKIMVWDRYPLSNAAEIAERSLSAEVALLDKNTAGAIAALQEAVKIEDATPYDEPPAWHSPTRHALGAVLLEAGKAVDAEAVYRAELERNPQNGWSLNGLAKSLRAQKRNAEAKEVERQFTNAWQHADVKLDSSRI